VVTEQLLRESNLIRGHFAGIKILGDGELKHGLKIEADKVSATAREKIEKAGGTITLREDGAPKAERGDAAAVTEVSPTEAPAESVSQPTGKKKSSKKPSIRAK